MRPSFSGWLSLCLVGAATFEFEVLAGLGTSRHIVFSDLHVSARCDITVLGLGMCICTPHAFHLSLFDWGRVETIAREEERLDIKSTVWLHQ